MENKIYTGHISRYDNTRNFGFIEDEDDKSYFFFFDRSEQKRLKKEGLIKNIQKFSLGDEVEFKLNFSENDKNRIHAWDVKFIRNLQKQRIVDEAISKGILHGYLKQFDNNKFFVKHQNTYVFIPVQISEWETDFNLVYQDRINKLVEFRLSKMQYIDRLEAVLTGRKFCAEHQEILELITLDHSTEACITGKSLNSFFATIFDGRVRALITTREWTDNQKEKYSYLKEGVKLNVKINDLFATKKVSLKLIDE